MQTHNTSSINNANWSQITGKVPNKNEMKKFHMKTNARIHRCFLPQIFQSIFNMNDRKLA